MKIAFILPKLVNQGPVIVARDIINNIVDMVDEIELFYFDNQVELEFKCKCTKISFFDKFDFDNFDVIHSHMLRSDAYVWYHRRDINKALCLSTIHQDINENLASNYNKVIAYVFEKIWIRFLKRQDVLVMLSNTMKQQYQSCFDKQRLITIYNGRTLHYSSVNDIDQGDFENITQLKRNYKIIGVLALLTSRKGIAQLVQALEYLDNFALIVIGDGKEMENLLTLALELKVENRCIFMGYRKEAHRYLSFFDLYAMTSYSEGFGLGLLEAAQFKLPVVCSDLPLFRELYTNNEVEFFELDNIQSLTSAVLNSIKRKNQLGNNLYFKVCNSYSEDKMASNYLEIYNSVFDK
jgi:glycosyltransferase involved in cell wall biosynthesis